MKKILSVLLLIIVISQMCFAIPAIAASSVSITASYPSSASIGETITITLSLSGSAGVAGIELTSNINSDILEYKSMSKGSYLSKFSGSSADNHKFVSYSLDNITGGGTIGTITCKVIRAYSSSDSLLTITGSIYNADVESVNYSFSTKTEIKKTDSQYYKELSSKISEAENIIASDYTTTSFNRLNSSVSSAKKILNSSNSTDSQYQNATASINDALSGLTYKLSDMISSAESYKQSNYTTASFNRLTSAISDAKNVLNTTVEKRAAQTKVLSAAINGLVKNSDIDNLKNKIEDAKNYNQDNYSKESYSVLQSAISAAENVLKNNDPSTADITAAIKKLDSAILSLKESPLSMLSNLIEQANNENKDDYTSDSYTAFYDALSQATNVLNNSQSSEQQLKEQITNLQNAINSLIPKPIKLLKDIISSSENMDLSIYTDESSELLKNLLEDGKQLLDEGGTDEEYTNAFNNIKDALNNLICAFDQILENAKALDPRDYTSESFAVFSDILSNVEKVATDSYATENDKIEAATKLKEAMDGLVLSARGTLKFLILDMHKLDSATYTTDSYSALTKKISEAQSLLDSDESTDEDFIAMTNEIKEIVDSLVVSNRVKLLKAIEEAKSIISHGDSDKYTEETYNKMAANLLSAENIYDDPSSTEEQYLNAYTSLRSSIDGLKQGKTIHYNLLLVCACVSFATMLLMVLLYFIIRYTAKKKQQKNLLNEDTDATEKIQDKLENIISAAETTDDMEDTIPKD